MSYATTELLGRYAEMVIAMFVGMLVLGLPAEGILFAVGTSPSALQTDVPAVLLVGMAVVMTLPMIGWVRYRGHGWRPCLELTAATLVPTIFVIALMWSALITDFRTLTLVEDISTLPSVLLVMLLRPEEYGGQAVTPIPSPTRVPLPTPADHE